MFEFLKLRKQSAEDIAQKAEEEYEWGFKYANGIDVPQDDSKAFKYYTKASDRGDPNALFDLGGMYLDGRGVRQSDKEALRCFRKAAEMGYGIAQLFLGTLYDRGSMVPQDDASAVKWYRLAAENGQVFAQYEMGRRYAKGVGVIKDSSLAYKWHLLAAEQGYADSQFFIAAQLLSAFDSASGGNTAANPIRWYRLAAEQGHIGAQFWLGFCLFEGRCVPKDIHEASKWLLLAAEKGDQFAQYQIAALYHTQSNLTEAFKWMRISAVSGIGNSRKELLIIEKELQEQWLSKLMARAPNMMCGTVLIRMDEEQRQRSENSYSERQDAWRKLLLRCTKRRSHEPLAKAAQDILVGFFS